MIAAVDRRLFAPGPESSLARLRTGLAAILLARIVLWPFAQLASSDPRLFDPPLLLSWLPRVPSAGVIVAVQLVAAVAAVVAIAGRRHAPAAFRFAWIGFLVLAGLKTSGGKILHNDVALLLAGAPVALSGAWASLSGRRVGADFGWPLRASTATLAVVYFLCGVQKLHHSGVAWVTSDNMRWILTQGAASGLAPTTRLATALASDPFTSHLVAAGLVGLELAFPVVLFSRRARPAFAAGAVLLHSMTWLTLGLDYWSWSLVALVVLVVAQPSAGGRDIISAILEKSTEMKMPSASARSSPPATSRPAV